MEPLKYRDLPTLAYREHQARLGRSHEQWKEWLPRAKSALATGDKAALEELRDEGFFPEARHPLGKEMNWWSWAFVYGGIKGLDALLETFPSQAKNCPDFGDILKAAEIFNCDIHRLREGHHRLSLFSKGWIETARHCSQPQNPSLALRLGIPRALEARQSGELSDSFLGDSGTEVLDALIGMTLPVLGLGIDGREIRPSAITLSPARQKAREEQIRAQQAPAFDLLRSLGEVARAYPGFQKQSWLETQVKFGVALSRGVGIDTLEPLLLAYGIDPAEPLSDQIARVNKESLARPTSMRDQRETAERAIRQSLIPMIIKGGDANDLARLRARGSLEDAKLYEWKSITHPYLVWQERERLRESLGREPKMQVRFETLRGLIESSGLSPAERKAHLDWLDGRAPEDAATITKNISLPVPVALSCAAVLFEEDKSASCALRLVEAGCSLRGLIEGLTARGNNAALEVIRSDRALCAHLEKEALAHETEGLASGARRGPRAL